MQTCLPKSTSVSTPICLCPYFQFDRNFVVVCVATDASPINQNNKSVKGHFTIIHLARTKKLAHYDTWMPLFCLHLLKSFWIKDCRTPSPKSMHPVCCFRWCQRVLTWTVLVWLELVSLYSSFPLSVSCSHLSLTAVYSNLPYLKLANFCKVLMQSQCALVQQAFLTNQDRPCTSAPEMVWNMQMSTGRVLQPQKWFEICKCQPTITPMLKDQLRWQQTRICSYRNFHTFWKLFVHILRNLHVHPYCQLISVQIQPNMEG